MEYITSFWNYIDIIPPIGICLACFFLLFYVGNDTMIRSILSITAFFMWIKLLYFMRIFKETGYLIRMITTVIIDMRFFFLVLVIGIVAFGDSFLSIAGGNTGDDVFTSGFINSIIYTYAIVLGGFDVTSYNNSMSYILVMCLFLLCTVFNMIVMFNLLIAIISESFANVSANGKSASF